MNFDPDNNVVKLCAQGMQSEGEGKPAEALKLFEQAWNEAVNDFEKFTAAHYVARHRPSVQDKLQWDETALRFALRVDDSSVKLTYPSLYLNIGKGYEDAGKAQQALKNYTLALKFAGYLPDDGYGNMIKQGIEKGIERTKTC